MKKLKGVIKITFKNFMARLSIKIFNYMFRNEYTGMKDIFENAIQQRTNASIIGWLDYKRIQHCVFCPRTDELPLIKHPIGMVCGMHKEQADRVWHANREKTEKAAGLKVV